MPDQTKPANTREAAIRRAKSKKMIRRIFYIAIPILVVLGTILWIAKNQTPTGPDMSVEYPNQGQEHIQINSQHPEYNSNPPTSGWHYAQPARLGFYDEELPDETLIHNLEHGEIWISYRPSIPDAVKEQLREFFGPRVIVTKREKNDTDIAVAAWTHLDAFNLESGVLTEEKTARINAFIERWQNRGPERIVSRPF